MCGWGGWDAEHTNCGTQQVGLEAPGSSRKGLQGHSIYAVGTRSRALIQVTKQLPAAAAAVAARPCPITHPLATNLSILLQKHKGLREMVYAQEFERSPVPMSAASASAPATLQCRATWRRLCSLQPSAARCFTTRPAQGTVGASRLGKNKRAGTSHASHTGTGK